MRAVLEETPNSRKLDVMNVLWERGPASLPEIRCELGGPPPPGLRRLVHHLEREGYVHAERNEGICRYSAALTRREVGRQAVRRVLRRYFGGSAFALLRAVAERPGWPDEKIRPLWKRLKKAKSESWLTARSV